MPIFGGYAVLLCNPDKLQQSEIVAQVKAKNINASDFKVNLKPGSEELFVFES